MDRIITLLRCSYKGLEIELEETPKPALTTKVKPVKQTSLNTATISNGYTSSSSSDGQGGPSTQTKQKKKKLKPPRTSGLTGVAVANPVVTASSLGCQEDEEGQTGQQTTLQFAPNVLSRPMRYAKSSHQLQIPLASAPQLEPSVTTHPTTQFCRGLRWACPIQGHTGHDLAGCHEFWSAKDSAV